MSNLDKDDVHPASLPFHQSSLDNDDDFNNNVHILKDDVHPASLVYNITHNIYTDIKQNIQNIQNRQNRQNKNKDNAQIHKQYNQNKQIYVKFKNTGV